VTVHPGDLVIGDADGVVVVEHATWPRALLPAGRPQGGGTRPRASPQIQARARRGRNGWTASLVRGGRAQGRRNVVSANTRPAKPVILVTAADLAPQALALLEGFDIVYAGKTPTEDDIVALCRTHDPVAIIVRYSKVGAAAMDAAPSCA
jgi:hypothetical protein